MGLQGYTLCFLFLLKTKIVGTRKNRIGEVILTNTHDLCFEQKYEKDQNFYLKSFHLFGVKYSIYLNRRVFVIVEVQGDF